MELTTTIQKAGIVALLAILPACGDSSGASTTHSSTSATGSSGAGAGGAADRGPTSVNIDGGPNGLIWDDAKRTLFLADDENNRILSWTDADGFTVVSTLPSASANGAGLGQLVETKDGSVVVTRFGYGTAGDVAVLDTSNKTSTVPGLDKTRRRIGLTVTTDGTLFDTYFIKNATQVGAIAKLDLSGSEADVIGGLVKPVGVLAVGDSLFVSDQTLNQILKAPISSPSSYSVFATLDGPDLLAAGPSGSIFSGSLSGNVYRIGSSGSASVFAGGFVATRGVAYDATNKRLFVVEHQTGASAGEMSLLHILPVDD